MHKIDALSFVGQPNENVTVSTQVDPGGQIRVTVDGQSVPENPTFQLPAAPGAHKTMEIKLAGPIGVACVVGIDVVDGGTAGDMLQVRAITPTPLHTYTFTTASQASVDALAALRSSKPASAPRRKRGGR